MPLDRHEKGPSVRTRRRLFRRAFCFPCDRWTLRVHRHADAVFSAHVAREVRP